MTLATRRFLYLIFVAAFFIITPLVIMYANGYQLGRGGRSLVKTGMLILDSEPAGAKIYLNGQSQRGFASKLLSSNDFTVTPAKLKGILPADYLVRFEHDGYWPWEKKLTVRPGESTYAEDVILFKKSEPVLVASGTAGKPSLSPDKKRLIFGDADRLAALDWASQAEPRLIAASGTIAGWSSDGRRFIAGRSIYQADTGQKLHDLEKLIGKNLSNIKWSGAEADSLFYQLNGQLYRFDLAGQKSESLLPTGLPATWPKGVLTDYLVKSGYAYLAYYQSGRIEVAQYDLGNKKIVRGVAVAGSNQISFRYPENDGISLLDAASRTLYLLDLDSFDPLIDTIPNIVDGRWIDASRLLAWNESEIFIYNASIKQKTLISRLSEAVKQAAWHPSNNYIIYATDRHLVSLELDDRDRRNTIELLAADRINGFEMESGTAAELYLSGSYRGQAGLFRLEL